VCVVWECEVGAGGLERRMKRFSQTRGKRAS
jgi:hypothetical protein